MNVDRLPERTLLPMPTGLAEVAQACVAGRGQPVNGGNVEDTHD
ncbi:hypothetical protein LIG30_1033 [Burkholderia sp. lig30]|jgi:hypothetical protein|nr:hypothetical protein [Burkholderia sp. lig30]KDB09831.1 hypothetical protein LIG30_1033 [Burkholderia sp. lig30]